MASDFSKKADSAVESMFFYYTEDEKVGNEVTSSVGKTLSTASDANDSAMTFTSASGGTNVKRKLTFLEEDSMALQAL